MPWLLRGRDVLATVSEARSFRSRAQGLLGREVEGVLLLEAWSVHTVGMRRTIDVAFCGRCTGLPRRWRGDGALELEVLAVRSMPPNRISRPRGTARFVLEADAGSFARWNLGPGDRLVVR